MIYTPVDRIEHLEPGRLARAVKLATRAGVSSEHWPVLAVTNGYPWSLAIETAFQCAHLVLAPVLPDDRHAILVRVDRAEFDGPIRFGARLTHEVRMHRRNDDMARFECDVAADGSPVGRMLFTMGIVPCHSELFKRGSAVYGEYLTRGWRSVAERNRLLLAEQAS